ncbi:Candidapepsin-10 [Spathaspora sp. JA1]|nr:Candidapepsin-10 [Spathaspora sp. JA1]
MFDIILLLYFVCVVLSNQAPLKLDIETRRSDGKELSQSYLEKRLGLSLPVSNQYSVYTTILRMGSNRDPVRVILDTGSSDLWVMSSQVNCVSKNTEAKRETIVDKILTGLNFKSQGEICTENGAFNYLASTSFVKNNTEPFSIGYIDGVTTKGFWGHDNVFFAGNSISNFSFAVAQETSSKIGVMGIGLAEAVSTNTKYKKQYENFPLKLKTSGIMNTTSYSIYMNSYSPPSFGAVLFGAIDHAKYSGNLTTVDIHNEANSLARLRIPISSIQVVNDQTDDPVTIVNKGPDVLLDTGCTYSRFPRDVVDGIAKEIGATYDTIQDDYYVDCDIASTLRLNFKGTPIDFPINELLRSAGDKCSLAIDVDENNSLSILGDNFLRRMYLYFDLDNKQISVAQAVYTDREDIEIVSENRDFQSQSQEVESEVKQEEKDKSSAGTHIFVPLLVLTLSLLFVLLFNV